MDGTRLGADLRERGRASGVAADAIRRRRGGHAERGGDTFGEDGVDLGQVAHHALTHMGDLDLAELE